MGFIIMCFHSSALTVGMMKKGEIRRMRTRLRPGKGASVRSAIRVPRMTVIRTTLPTSSRVFIVAVMNDGSVTKYSQFSRPMNPVWSGCIRLYLITEK